VRPLCSLIMILFLLFPSPHISHTPNPSVKSTYLCQALSLPLSLLMRISIFFFPFPFALSKFLLSPFLCLSSPSLITTPCYSFLSRTSNLSAHPQGHDCSCLAVQALPRPRGAPVHSIHGGLSRQVTMHLHSHLVSSRLICFWTFKFISHLSF
jgi:hypothetical protein